MDSTSIAFGNESIDLWIVDPSGESFRKFEPNQENRNVTTDFRRIFFNFVLIFYEKNRAGSLTS